MITHYLKVALRNLLKYKAHSFIIRYLSGNRHHLFLSDELFY